MERGEEVLREFLHPDPYIGACPPTTSAAPVLCVLSPHTVARALSCLHVFSIRYSPASPSDERLALFIRIAALIV